MITECVFCGATGQPQTEWTLPEPVQWISAFTHAGQEPPMAAGRYTTCGRCTAWVPRHRAGALPAVVLQGIHAAVEGLHPATRRQLHAELVGRYRHLAAQLEHVTEAPW